MPKISPLSRFVHGGIAFYHAVGLYLLYSGWPFQGRSSHMPSSIGLGSLYGDSYPATDETANFTCFGLNSQIIVGVLYAKCCIYGDASLARDRRPTTLDSEADGFRRRRPRDRQDPRAVPP